MLSLGEDDYTGLLYLNVRNNIGGDMPTDVPPNPTKILEGMCPRHPRQR